MKEKRYRPYRQHQLSLLPPSLDELIPENHVVRLLNTVVEGLDLSGIESTYRGKGAPAYHPRMLLKVVVYAYLCNTYSSRKIEARVKSDIHFMWLSGMQMPDHNTINRFRSTRLKGTLKAVFGQVVGLLAGEGLVSLEKVYVDGTKIEANANRYTFVWRKSVERYKNRIKEELEEVWAYAEGVAKAELGSDAPPIGEGKVDKEKVAATIERLNGALAGKELPGGVKKN